MIPLTHEQANTLFSLLSITEKRILISLVDELQAAIKKHPKWPNDLIHAAAIVTEENGELMQACLQHKYEGGNFDNIEKEAVQTGAMCMRLIFNLPTPLIKQIDGEPYYQKQNQQ